MTVSDETKLPQRNGSYNAIKIAALGAVAGGAIGLIAANRRTTQPGATQEAEVSLVDWDRVRAYATKVNQGDALTATERVLLDAKYQALVARSIPIVSTYMGVDLDAEREKVFALDRVDWINANIDAFKLMLGPLESLYAAQSQTNSSAGKLWGGLTSNVASTELGILMGYLARRVLGQYDIAILGREAVDSGSLYFVEPNIKMVARNLNVPIEELRLWLALHETTHAFQFEAFPWVRPHFNSLLERYFEFLKGDIEELGKGITGLKTYANRMRKPQNGSSWMESLMTPDQHQLYEEIQALMCVIEGYSNHVMNVTGKDVMPTFDDIRRKFERRQQEKSKAEQLFARFTGLDIKMEQYRLGQAFVDGVVAERGHDFAKLMWLDPAFLPTLAEIRAPALWMSRMDATSSAGHHHQPEVRD